VRILTWTIRIVLFLLLLALAAKNVEPVKLRFFFDIELETPLVLLLLGAFALGAFFGVLALLTTVLRQRREISVLKKPAQPAPPSV
jgi:lipopolysaccharide assembly protein A